MGVAVLLFGIKRWRGAAAAVVLVLGGCSSVTVFYSFADSFIEREVESYLDLDGGERLAVEEKIDALVVWHRTEMLPEYAALLRAHADRIDAGDITRETVKRSYDEVRALLLATLQGAFKPAASVLVHHTGTEKLAHLRHRMAERMEDRIERGERTREDRVERRTRRYTENFERFAGPLTPPQIAAIRRHAEASDADSATWLDYRQRRETVFVEFLATHPGEAEIEAFAEKILLRAEDVVGPGYRAYRDAGAARLQDLIHEILALSTLEQRRNASATLRGYADDFIRLSRRMF
jgi:hypothetical protein